MFPQPERLLGVLIDLGIPEVKQVWARVKITCYSGRFEIEIVIGPALFSRG